MFDRIKVGERSLNLTDEVFGVFYNQQNNFLERLKKIGREKICDEDLQNIFLDSLVLLVEKFCKGQGKTDYTELRKLLFGISKIKTYEFIAVQVNKTFQGHNNPQPRKKEIVIFDTPHQIWFRKYYRKWYDKNREKINAKARSPEVKKIRNAKFREKRRIIANCRKQNIPIPENLKKFAEYQKRKHKKIQNI